MDSYSDIKDRIRRISGSGSMTMFTAMVKRCDGERCTVDIDGMELTGVRLRSVVNGADSRVMVTPKEGSYVTVIDLSGGRMTELVVVGYSEVEKIDIDCEGDVLINGGDNGGLVNIEYLEERLKRIEENIDGLKDVFISWVPVARDGGAALKSAASVWLTEILGSTERRMLEDTRVKH